VITNTKLLFNQKFFETMEKVKKTLLFNASCLALIVTAMSFGTRGGFIIFWMNEFNLTGAEVGWIVGTAFWGFTLAMLVLGPLVDLLGMGRVITIAFIAHIAGLVLTVFATGFWSLFFSTLLIGIANGSVEAGCNPLITALFPNDKTAKLNRFHMWFPAGIVIGALVVYFLNMAGLGWRIQTAVMLIPTVGYGIMFFNQKFPQTERVSSGASYKDMLKACVSPLFLFLAFFMLFTAATELGTNQWIAALLNTVQAPGILLLVWVSAVMALARLFAGPIIHKLSSVGVLLASSIVAGIGLWLLSVSVGWWTFGAATVFALGVAYFWPNMLGVVAEQIPTSGALGLAIMGGLGFLGAAIAQPTLGYIYDINLIKYANDPLAAGSASLRYVILLTVALTLAFSYLYYKHRKNISLKAV
jgi:MFS family permease